MTVATIRGLLVTFLLVAVGAGSIAAQKPYDLFQQALAKERSDGKLDEAVQLYQRVVKEAGTDRALAAKALVQLAGCYEKLKRPEAQKTYEQVITQFPEQTDVVAQARAHLAPAAQPAGVAAPVPREPTLRRVSLPQGARVSPDGRWAVFTDFRVLDLSIRDLATGDTRLLVKHTETGGKTTADVEGPEFVAWSRDSKRLAYTWCYHDPPGGDHVGLDLRVISVDGSGERVIYQRVSHEALVMPWDWSPDGRSIALRLDAQPTSGTSAFGLLSVADGVFHSLKTFNTRAELGRCSDSPGLSPDGRYLAYGRITPARRCDIFALATDGTGERPLVQHAANDQFLAWTPNGSVLFVSDRSGTNDLWLTHVVDGRADGLPERVRRDVGAAVMPSLTSAGALHFMGIAPASDDVYVAALDAESGAIRPPVAPITQDNAGANRAPAWSRDGRHLSYGTAPADTHRYDSVTIVSVDSGEARTIRVQPRMELILGHVSWSPDGRWFVMNARTNGAFDAYKVDAQSGVATPLGAGRELGGLKMAPDGRTLVFGHAAANGVPPIPGVSTRDLETGAERAFYRPEAGLSTGNLALSPDGRLEAMTLVDPKARTVVLQVVDIASGVARKIVPLQSPAIGAGGKVDWSPDGRYLYYVERLPGTATRDEVWRVPVAGGPARNTGLALDDDIQGIKVSPDNRHIAFSLRHQPLPGNFVLEQFLPAVELMRASPGGGSR